MRLESHMTFRGDVKIPQLNPVTPAKDDKGIDL